VRKYRSTMDLASGVEEDWKRVREIFGGSEQELGRRC